MQRNMCWVGLCVFAFFSTSSALAQTEQVAILPNTAPIPLTSVAVDSRLDAPLDPDDPGTGGGFETKSYFQTRLTSAKQIADCGQKIESAVAKWALGVNLIRSKYEKNTNYLSLYYSNTTLKGLFAITYKLEQGIHARIRVDFYTLDGEFFAPETMPGILKDYQMMGLQDSLDEAIACGPVA